MDRDFLQRNWHQASNEAIYWNRLSNDRVSEVNKQLLSVALLLLPLSASVLGIKEGINDVIKTILIGAWTFLIISIIFGFIDIYKGSRFFNRYTQYNASRAQIYYEYLRNGLNPDLAENRIFDRLQAPPLKSSDLYLTLQIISISIGLALIMGVATFLLIVK